MPKRTRYEWQQLAEYRILNILRRRRLCNLRQLEAKIAEAGPPDRRPQPWSIHDACQALLQRGAIKIGLPRASSPGINTDFYALPHFDPGRWGDKPRLDIITAYWPRYHKVTGTYDLSGKALETLVEKAVDSSALYVRLGQTGKGFEYTVDGLQVRNIPALDHILFCPGDRITIGIEDKNWAGWMYPHEDDIRELLQTSLLNGHLPVLVTRKLPYLTRLLFKRLGILGFETHFQYFHPSAEKELAIARHKHGLGFAYIRFATEPPEPLVRFFAATLPANVDRVREVFASQEPVVRAYAEKEIDYNELMRTVGIFEEREEAEPTEDDWEAW
jgi:hypothetical protein